MITTEQRTRLAEWLKSVDGYALVHCTDDCVAEILAILGLSEPEAP